MISTINTLLAPIETIIKKYQKYIGYFFIALSFASLFLIFSSETVKFTGEQAMNLLWLILFLPILARVVGLSLAQIIMPLRKEIGILMGTLAFVHGAAYIFPDMAYMMDVSFWIHDGLLSYLAFGFFALIATLPLLLTSNVWAIRKLGKNWKRLHRIVYIVAIFTVIHIALIRGIAHFEYGQIVLLGLYLFGKILEWKGVKVFKSVDITYPKGQKWLCVPCGYIYDPIDGDEDSGIAPGTEFSDIADNWRCPVCGVSKRDFVPFTDEQKIATHVARAVYAELLNPTTLELVIETEEHFTSRSGQFMSFLWSDDEGEFLRSYSIVRQVGNQFTFLIKLDDKGRGARILRHIGIDADIHIKGVFGNFLLQDGNAPKVFIATGTGLAPIYNMITTLPAGVKKVLYFTVSTEAELFYIEKLRQIANLDLHIHTTREQVEGYSSGRVDVDTITATPDTEWYLCGNSHMVSDVKEKLAARGMRKVYSEEFS